MKNVWSGIELPGAGWTALFLAIAGIVQQMDLESAEWPILAIVFVIEAVAKALQEGRRTNEPGALSGGRLERSFASRWIWG